MDLRQLVIDEFSGENAQKFYAQKAEEGLWDSEQHFIQKYFTNRRGKLLDMGCGTGRTTLPLHEKGYRVVGVDLVPAMVESARRIARAKGKEIHYEAGDATSLRFPDCSFDYVLFSNQGWTQIPGSAQRLAALREMRRVLRPEGVLIFTAHPRVYARRFALFWLQQALRFSVMKPLGFDIPEVDYGDRFFEREPSEPGSTHRTTQYIHIPSRGEVCAQIADAGLALLEANGELQISAQDIMTHPPVFYVCRRE